MVHPSGGVRLSVLERPSMLFHMLMKTEMKASLILVFCWVGFGMVHCSGGVRLKVLSSEMDPAEIRLIR